MGNFSLVGIADKILGTNARETFLGNLIGGNDLTGVASIFTGNDPTGSLASAVSVSAENGLKSGIGTPLRIGGNTAPAFQTLFPRLGARHCGATTDFGTSVNLHRSDHGFDDPGGDIFVAAGRHHLDLKWIDADRLNIECADCSRKQVSKTVTILGKTEIHCDLPAIAVASREH